MNQSSSDEFYVGYQPNMPNGFKKFLRPFVLFLFIIAIALTFIIASNQNEFPNSRFELGQLTEVQGIYTSHPVPMLKIPASDQPRENDGSQFESILLIGFGKFSALPTVKSIEAERGASLEGKLVTLKGTQIYYDGKKLLELTQKEQSLLAVSNPTVAYESTSQDLGEITLKGEIVDPKCYFGVMKPGDGKVHRSCASRCLAGGIPPVIKVNKTDGTKNYYLLEGLEYESFKPYIGKYIKIKGTVEKRDDWLVFNTVPTNTIQSLTFNDAPPMCTSSICAEF